MKKPLHIPQVLQKNVHPTAPQPNYPPVVSAQPPKAQQQQRPVSIHSFSSLQNPAPSKPLSPLPLLQTSSPQFHSPSFASPRGWAHVDSPRSPGAVNQQSKTFYNAAPIASPPFELTNSTSSFEQPQVRSWVSHAGKKYQSLTISDGCELDILTCVCPNTFNWLVLKLPSKGIMSNCFLVLRLFGFRSSPSVNNRMKCFVNGNVHECCGRSSPKQSS